MNIRRWIAPLALLAGVVFVSCGSPVPPPNPVATLPGPAITFNPQLATLVKITFVPDPLIVVTTTDDPGAHYCTEDYCALREAIEWANSTYMDHATIRFNIPGGGVHTIRPVASLPALERTITIDGTSQPGYTQAGGPVIELDGSLAGDADGLEVKRTATIKGLAINRFQGAGIAISGYNSLILWNVIGANPAGQIARGNTAAGIAIYGGKHNTLTANVISGNTGNGVLITGNTAADNVVRGNKIGTTADGSAPLGNQGNGVAILDGVDDTNTIGGTAAYERNLISANAYSGVYVDAAHILIRGNYIGTDASGNGALGNHDAGIWVRDGDDLMVGGGPTASGGNLISGNLSMGLYIEKGDFITVLGNTIGANAAGAAALPNQTGLYISDCAAHARIGGDVPAQRNLISGNGGAGIYVASGCGAAADMDIRGNYIGIDRAGAAALPNESGIDVMGDHVEVGGSTAAMGNVISGNVGYGVLLAGKGAVLRYNRIGTTPVGLTALPNGGAGVLIKGGSESSITENTIAYNGEQGVAVSGFGPAGKGTRNRIQANSIFENGWLGIALDKNTVLPNDPLDSDSGSNRRQNHPELTTATDDGFNYVVTGSVNSEPNTVFRIDLYASPECDPSGYGEGRFHMANVSLTTNGSGDGVFTGGSPAFGPVIAGYAITATATDPQGNTSEFSKCILLEKAGKATATPTATPTSAQKGLEFNPKPSTKHIYYRGTGCGAMEVRMDLSLSDPSQVIRVDFYYRLLDKATNEFTGWSNASMSKNSAGLFSVTLKSTMIPGYSAHEEAYLVYEFVAVGAGEEVIARSPRFWDVEVSICHK